MSKTTREVIIAPEYVPVSALNNAQPTIPDQARAITKMSTVKLASKILCASILILLIKWISSSSIKLELKKEVGASVNVSNEISPDATYDDLKTIERFSHVSIDSITPALTVRELPFLKCYASAIKSELYPSVVERTVDGKCNATSDWMSGYVHLDECIMNYIGQEYNKLSCVDAVLLLEDLNESLGEMHRQVCGKRYEWINQCAQFYQSIYDNIYVKRLDSRTFGLIRYFSISSKTCPYDGYYEYRCKEYDGTELNRDLWNDLIVKTYNLAMNSNETTAYLPVSKLNDSTYLIVVNKLLAKIQEEIGRYWSSVVNTSTMTQGEFVRFYRHYITSPCRRYMKISSPSLDFNYALANYAKALGYESSQIDIAVFRREFCWRFTRADADIEALKVYLKTHKRDSEGITQVTRLPDLDPSFVRFDWRKLIKLS